MQFKCGHGLESDRLKYFGRGAARAKRLSAYLDRKCQACAEVSIREQAERLTLMDGSPAPAEYRRRKAAEWIDRLRLRY